MSFYIVALCVGFVAGLRAFVPLAAVAWASALGVLHVSGTWAGFLASPWTVGIFSVLTVVEFVTDQLPGTPSRKVLKQFAPRLVSGGFSGAAVGVTGGILVGGLVGGLIGAVAGTFLGYEFRRGLVRAMGGRDWPVAILEDGIAIAIAVLSLFALG
ncbi:DUF4126 family protein [Paraburkholderia caledonica]|uniref:Membrane protein n=1 Tax=Paraburkholderia caledonica TaxID=134536 RepID=A0ABU1KYZ3_9BURK|nr:DUF4126 family protein [Paraburkholderia caledonica]MDR6376199.1 putative membrane protein [Paraburkholderia caledonica]